MTKRKGHDAICVLQYGINQKQQQHTGLFFNNTLYLMACIARCMVSIITYYFSDITTDTQKEALCLFDLPFWRISRCSHRMSPTKAGARAWKASFPIAHMSLPFMRNWWRAIPSRENSFVAHCIQWATWLSVHWRGSVKKFIVQNLSFL